MQTVKALGAKAKLKRTLDAVKRISKSNFQHNHFIIDQGGKGKNAIAISSAKPKEGKTLSTIATAYHLVSYTKEPVLLIDCDRRNKGLSRELNIGSKKGFTDFFLGNEPSEHCISSTGLKYFQLMSYGNAEIPVSKVCTDTNFAARLEQLKDEYRYILFDLPSIQSAPDICLLGPLLDGVVLVVECEKTRWFTVQDAVERVKSANAQIIGTILNRKKLYVPKFFYG